MHVCISAAAGPETNTFVGAGKLVHANMSIAEHRWACRASSVTMCGHSAAAVTKPLYQKSTGARILTSVFAESPMSCCRWHCSLPCSSHLRGPGQTLRQQRSGATIPQWRFMRAGCKLKYTSKFTCWNRFLSRRNQLDCTTDAQNGLEVFKRTRRIIPKSVC